MRRVMSVKIEKWYSNLHLLVKTPPELGEDSLP
jgi:hypothetical protein